jgi:hypothetical protein
MEMAFAFLYPAVGWFFYLFLPLAPAIYLVLRWRAYREGGPADPQLGLKALLSYFRTMAYHLILAGEFCLLFGLMEADQRWDLLRLAAAFGLAGGLIFGWQAWLLARRTNAAEFPTVARFYQGFNVLICGLVAMVALVVALGAVLAEEVPWMVFKIGAALVVVYGSAWFFQVRLLLRSSTAPTAA